MLTTVEAIGDITATEEASALTTFGDKHNKRVQGGLLGDGQHPLRPLSLPLPPVPQPLPAGLGVLYTPSFCLCEALTPLNNASVLRVCEPEAICSSVH